MRQTHRLSSQSLSFARRVVTPAPRKVSRLPEDETYSRAISLLRFIDIIKAYGQSADQNRNQLARQAEGMAGSAGGRAPCVHVFADSPGGKRVPKKGTAPRGRAV